MKPSIAAKLDQLSLRLEEVGRLLTAQNVTADMDQYRRLTREHAELEPVVALYRQYQAGLGDLKTAQEMAADPAMREF
ncbi:MAG: PCRF domain-containing protein, partial [Roseomonas sp.]|nr:PCRF domain-containing protein [Roseomonas sp.]